MQTLYIEKLSEDNLGDCLRHMFPNAIITHQKRIKINKSTLIVDYEVSIDNHILYIEFDGPTHYTKTKTQIRDIKLKQFCLTSNITLIRIPYFIQFNDASIRVLFGNSITEAYNIENSVLCSYPCGFWDKKIVTPADYNPYGCSLFISQYQYFFMKEFDYFSQSQAIHDSATLNFDKEEFIGLNPTDDMILFWHNYPT